MAVELYGAGNDKIDYGDLPVLGGQTEFTLAYTLFIDAVEHAEFIVHTWGSTEANRAFCSFMAGTDDITFIISDGTEFFRQESTNAGISAPQLVRVVLTWKADPKLMQFWIDGIKRNKSTITDGNPATLNDPSDHVIIGRGANDGPDGDYSEVAMWDRVLSDAECIAYGKGFSPRFFRNGGLFYAPLHNVDSLRDEWGGAVGTPSGAANAPHPTMLYPSLVTIQPPTVAPPVGAAVPILSSKGVHSLVFGGQVISGG